MEHSKSNYADRSGNVVLRRSSEIGGRGDIADAGEIGIGGVS